MIALIARDGGVRVAERSPTAVDRFVDLFAARLGRVSRKVKTIPGGKLRPPPAVRVSTARQAKEGQILALGHSDTVWPVGTLATMPFREAEGRLWGPGVLDMKAGIAFFVYAVRALRELDIRGAPQGRAAVELR